MKTQLLTASIICILLSLTAPATAQTRKTTAPKKSTTTSTTAKKPGVTISKAAVAKTAQTPPVTSNTQPAKKDSAVIAYNKSPEVQPAPAKPTQAVYTTSTAATGVQSTTINPVAPVTQNPFARGTISFVNKGNISYDNYKSKPEVYKVGDLSVAADLNYFIINNFAVGVDLRYSNYSSKGAVSSTYNYYMAYLNLTYGRSITPRLAIYGRVGGGLGHSKSTISSNTSGPLTADYKNYHGSIGAPITVGTEGSIFVTPYFAYDVTKTKAGNHDITEKGGSFGVKLETYLNSNHNKRPNGPISPWPKQGVSFIEYSTMGSYSFSKRKEFQGTVRFGDVKTNMTSIGLGYHYYFLDYLAGGLNLSYYSKKTDNGSAIKENSFKIEPTVTIHPPVETPLRQLFLQAGYGFAKGKYGGTKQDDSDIKLRLGYNLFVAKNISFTPKIGYQRDKSTHHSPGGDREYIDSGLAIELGVRAWINTNWMHKK